MPYRINAITGELNLTNSTEGSSSPAPCKVQTDSGTADLLNISGSKNISTSGSGSTVTIALDSDITANSFTTVGPHQNLTISKEGIQANGSDPNIPLSILAKGSSPVTLGPSVSIDALNIDGNSISCTNTNGAIVLEPNGSGSVQISYGTQNSLLYFGESGSVTNLAPLTDGQLVIGSSNNSPKAATLTAGKDIKITQGPGSITIVSTAADDKVVGPSDSIDSNFCAFDDTTGKLIRDSGVSMDHFVKVKNNLADLDDKKEAIAILGVRIGHDVQAYSKQLDSVEKCTGFGLVVKNRASNWVGRTITGATNQITVTNGNGILGNPKIQLPRTIHTNISFDSGENVLDTYTDDTWTPILQFGAGSVGITYSTQIAKYWKIGSIVHFNIKITLTNKGSSVGAAVIPNLPFSAAKDECVLTCTMSCGAVTTTPGATQFFCETRPGLKMLVLANTGSNNIAGLSNLNFRNDSTISITGFYWTD
jgi:hypothetical protein